MEPFPLDMIAQYDRVQASTSAKVDKLIDAYRKGIRLGHTETQVTMGIIKKLKQTIEQQIATPDGQAPTVESLQQAHNTLLYLLIESVRKLAAHPVDEDWNIGEL